MTFTLRGLSDLISGEVHFDPVSGQITVVSDGNLLNENMRDIEQLLGLTAGFHERRIISTYQSGSAVTTIWKYT